MNPRNDAMEELNAFRRLDMGVSDIQKLIKELDGELDDMVAAIAHGIGKKQEAAPPPPTAPPLLEIEIPEPRKPRHSIP